MVVLSVVFFWRIYAMFFQKMKKTTKILCVSGIFAVFEKTIKLAILALNPKPSHFLARHL